jgi:predicted nucleic acid-binding protein
MVAPSLLPYELASVCGKKMRKEPARSEVFRTALQGYVDMAVELVDLTPLAVLQNVELFKLSAYDAAYLCLAMQRNAQLITLDADLGKAAKKLGLLA